MKKTLTLLAAIMFFSGLIAQENFDEGHNGFAKGDKFISGLISYGSVSHSDDSKEKNFNVSPRLGFFLNDFIAVGGRLGFAWYQKKLVSGDRVSENSTFTAGAFGRYYLLPGSRFSVFGELGLGFGSTKNMNGKWTNGVNVGFLPGLSYFIGQHFAFEASIGILSYNTVNSGNRSGSTDSFDVGINLEDIQFGVIYKF